MEVWLNSILSDIETGKLLPSVYFQQLDCNKALDARDKDKKFDDEWTRLFEELNRRWGKFKIVEGERKLAEDIRRESFMTVSLATKQHEIASHISDDFDLIVRSKLIRFEDKVLDYLWAAYEKGEFPCPPFPE